MTDYPLLVWEMYATSPQGERTYMGCCDTEHAADMFSMLASESGFTEFEKRQVVRGNHGTSMLPRGRLQ